MPFRNCRGKKQERDRAQHDEVRYDRSIRWKGMSRGEERAAQDNKYVRYIANRRLEGINLEHRFDNEDNPFPWMSEVIDLPKEKNFFETRVTEYQNGSLEDDVDL